MKIGGAIFILLILLAGGFYLLVSTGKIPNLFNKNKATSLGEQIYNQTKNPLEDKIPETNPFSKVNPFKGVYKNPFE